MRPTVSTAVTVHFLRCRIGIAHEVFRRGMYARQCIGISRSQPSESPRCGVALLPAERTALSGHDESRSLKLSEALVRVINGASNLGRGLTDAHRHIAIVGAVVSLVKHRHELHSIAAQRAERLGVEHPSMPRYELLIRRQSPPLPTRATHE